MDRMANEATSASSGYSWAEEDVTNVYILHCHEREPLVHLRIDT